MKELIVANFKMNKTLTETKEYVKNLNGLIDENAPKICLCLPFTSLYVSKIYKGEKLCFGAQNMHEEENGSYTGEISAPMLKDLNVKMVILGHNERKKYGENYAAVNKKIKTALRYNFEAIICVGDSRAQKNSNKTKVTLESQIVEVLSGIYENELTNIIFVYEPIWAIGTGKIADIGDVKNAVEIIRNCVSKLYSTEAGKKVKVLYGGSVTSDTAKHFFKLKTLNGLLIGANSLDANEFAKIIKE